MDRWLKDGKYLPKFMRDFHKTKLLFKMFHTKQAKPEPPFKRPHWMDGQVYVIDLFLYFMAKRGYTLQKSRQKFDFEDIDKELDEFQEYLRSLPL